MFRLLITLTVFAVASSCSSKQVKQPASTTHNAAAAAAIPIETFPVDTVMRRIACKNDSTQSFALYLPPSYSSSSRFPVICFFDPHGDGSLPVSKYHLLARQFGYILIGSNNARNGLSLMQTNNMAATLDNDIRSRISTDDRRFTWAGFSGGAKVALSYAYHQQKVSNVIYAGAMLPLPQPSPQVAMLGFAGVNDMNYTDLITFDQSLSAGNLSHFLIEWNGKHEWPDTAAFRDAYYWTYFQGIRNHLQQADASLIQQFLNNTEKEIAKTKDPLVAAMQLNKAIAFLNGVTSIENYKLQLDALTKDSRYQEAMQKKWEEVKLESTLKQEYYAALQDRDLAWWKIETAKMNAVTDQGSTAMHHRLLGFISLACYSLSGSYIAQNQWAPAEKTLAVYKLADPKNAEQPFLEACYFAKLGQNKNAIKALKRCVELGLKDPGKIQHEPALHSLQQEPEFIILLAKLQQQSSAVDR